VSKSKTCRTCKTFLPIEYFHKNKRKCYEDGRNTQCKHCCRKREKKHVGKFNPLKEKKCNQCGVVKKAKYFHRNGGKRTGLCEDCKVCRNKKIVEKRYNLEEGQLEQMKKDVDYKCELCNNETSLAVDHCHKSGKVRGMLCAKCNTGIGQLNDDIELMKRAIKYIKDRS